jgi:TatD DNase family protein
LSVALAEHYEHIYAVIGAHPVDSTREHTVSEVEGFDPALFESLVAHPKVVAIGECGLDYYRMDTDEKKVKEWQKEMFVRQIEFAQKHHQPLMIHGRPSKGTMDAYEDILELLGDFQFEIEYPGNVHFFVGDTRIAQQFLDLGFTLSFDGPVTFTTDYHGVIRYIPKGRILAETDAPFAAPAPYRGKRNEPIYVKEIVSVLAAIREIDEEVFRQELLITAARVFKIPVGLDS